MWPGLLVHVAKKNRVTSTGICDATRIHISDEQFILDCYVLPIEGFDVVLGINWLSSLGPNVWEFKTLSMAFWYDDHPVNWHGIGGMPPSLSTLATARDLMTELLARHNNLFIEPRGLQPPRCHDHRVHLLPRSPPVAVHPYRYVDLLKDKIER